jgi:hypothetical protein
MPKNFKNASKNTLAALSLAGQVAISQPVTGTDIKDVYEKVLKTDDDQELKNIVSKSQHQEVMAKLVGFANLPAGHLEEADQLYLEQQLADLLGFEVVSELEGHKLNHSIGVMGAEQHLKRFSGDTLAEHDSYREAGIAPNRGAWGHFVQGSELTSENIQREKYYFAVQTLYLPDWNSNHQELKPWYKYRKMVVINPAEEKAVVGVVADAGPAMWVKKQFGGSPEVIREGKIWSPKTNGKIILLFVDDPNDEVPLGAVDLNFKD